MVEEITHDEPSRKGLPMGLSEGQAPISIASVDLAEVNRFSSGSAELDRVLGGGIIPGSMVLVVGDPGVGKSSLTLQVSAFVARHYGGVLYVTGEESARQVRLRAERLGTIEKELFVMSETNIELIEQQALKIKPVLLVVDSIQTVFRPQLESAPGSVSQVRESAVLLLKLAKTAALATLVVGHVTKDGSLAGPRVLEHIVDTVLYFEGDRHNNYRVLRGVKNRFGSTNEIGLFEMRNEGLLDVPDASGLFLSERPLDVSGSVVVPTMEGTRPVLVEVQALVGASPFMPPRRTSDCVDLKRIQLLVAVLEKRVGLLLGSFDVFIKVAGGIRVEEPALDLGLVVALASSHRNSKTIEGTVVFGEVGLAGEVRAVSQVEARIREAEKMGFKRIILPRGNLKSLASKPMVELIGVETVSDGLEASLEK